jgi:hypothetical protein
LILISVYIFLIVAIVFFSIFHSMSQVTESNAFMIFTNRTNESWLAAWIFWRVIFKVGVALEHPQPFMKPACSWRPFCFRWSFICDTMIELRILERTSRS